MIKTVENIRIYEGMFSKKYRRALWNAIILGFFP